MKRTTCIVCGKPLAGRHKVTCSDDCADDRHRLQRCIASHLKTTEKDRAGRAL